MSMPPFATVADLRALWRPMTPAETERAQALLPIVSDRLRLEAKKYGQDLDEMLLADEALESVAKSVTVDVTARALQTPTNETPMTQTSMSALGYSASGTYLVPGGGIFIKNSELSALGLRRQQMGVIEPYELTAWDPGCAPDAAL